MVKATSLTEKATIAIFYMMLILSPTHHYPSLVSALHIEAGGFGGKEEKEDTEESTTPPTLFPRKDSSSDSNLDMLRNASNNQSNPRMLEQETDADKASRILGILGIIWSSSFLLYKNTWNYCFKDVADKTEAELDPDLIFVRKPNIVSSMEPSYQAGLKKNFIKRLKLYKKWNRPWLDGFDILVGLGLFGYGLYSQIDEEEKGLEWTLNLVGMITDTVMLVIAVGETIASNCRCSKDWYKCKSSKFRLKFSRMYQRINLGASILQVGYGVGLVIVSETNNDDSHVNPPSPPSTPTTPTVPDGGGSGRRLVMETNSTFTDLNTMLIRSTLEMLEYTIGLKNESAAETPTTNPTYEEKVTRCVEETLSNFFVPKPFPEVWNVSVEETFIGDTNSWISDWNTTDLDKIAQNYKTKSPTYFLKDTTYAALAKISKILIVDPVVEALQNAKEQRHLLATTLFVRNSYLREIVLDKVDITVELPSWAFLEGDDHGEELKSLLGQSAHSDTLFAMDALDSVILNDILVDNWESNNITSVKQFHDLYTNRTEQGWKELERVLATNSHLPQIIEDDDTMNNILTFVNTTPIFNNETYWNDPNIWYPEWNEQQQGPRPRCNIHQNNTSGNDEDPSTGFQKQFWRIRDTLNSNQPGGGIIKPQDLFDPDQATPLSPSESPERITTDACQPKSFPVNFDPFDKPGLVRIRRVPVPQHEEQPPTYLIVQQPTLLPSGQMQFTHEFTDFGSPKIDETTQDVLEIALGVVSVACVAFIAWPFVVPILTELLVGTVEEVMIIKGLKEIGPLLVDLLKGAAGGGRRLLAGVDTVVLGNSLVEKLRARLQTDPRLTNIPFQDKHHMSQVFNKTFVQPLQQQLTNPQANVLSLVTEVSTQATLHRNAGRYQRQLEQSYSSKMNLETGRKYSVDTFKKVNQRQLESHRRKFSNFYRYLKKDEIDPFYIMDVSKLFSMIDVDFYNMDEDHWSFLKQRLDEMFQTELPRVLGNNEALKNKTQTYSPDTKTVKWNLKTLSFNITVKFIEENFDQIVKVPSPSTQTPPVAPQVDRATLRIEMTFSTNMAFDKFRYLAQSVNETLFLNYYYHPQYTSTEVSSLLASLHKVSDILNTLTSKAPLDRISANFQVYTDYKNIYQVTCDGRFASSHWTTDPLTYTWDLGDKSPKKHGDYIFHHYAKGGTYIITLEVKDVFGHVGSDMRSVTIIYDKVPQLQHKQNCYVMSRHQRWMWTSGKSYFPVDQWWGGAKVATHFRLEKWSTTTENDYALQVYGTDGKLTYHYLGVWDYPDRTYTNVYLEVHPLPVAFSILPTSTRFTIKPLPSQSNGLDRHYYTIQHNNGKYVCITGELRDRYDTDLDSCTFTFTLGTYKDISMLTGRLTSMANTALSNIEIISPLTNFKLQLSDGNTVWNFHPQQTAESVGYYKIAHSLYDSYLLTGNGNGKSVTFSNNAAAILNKHQWRVNQIPWWTAATTWDLSTHTWEIINKEGDLCLHLDSFKGAWELASCKVASTDLCYDLSRNLVIRETCKTYDDQLCYHWYSVFSFWGAIFFRKYFTYPCSSGKLWCLTVQDRRWVQQGRGWRKQDCRSNSGYQPDNLFFLERSEPIYLQTTQMKAWTDMKKNVWVVDLRNVATNKFLCNQGASGNPILCTAPRPWDILAVCNGVQGCTNNPQGYIIAGWYRDASVAGWWMLKNGLEAIVTPDAPLAWQNLWIFERSGYDHYRILDKNSRLCLTAITEPSNHPRLNKMELKICEVYNPKQYWYIQER